MKPEILVASICFHRERWDDPGDYPSGAGGYPLPSYWYNEFDSGSYTVQYTAAQMSTFAVELELVPEFEALTCNQVYAMSAKTDNERNALWLDWIRESLDYTMDLGFNRNVIVLKETVAYKGDGKFEVIINDAECEYTSDDRNVIWCDACQNEKQW